MEPYFFFCLLCGSLEKKKCYHALLLLQLPVLTRVLKCVVPPSSEKLSWDTVSGLLSIVCPQSSWKPNQLNWKYSGKSAHDLSLFINSQKLYYQFVDAHQNEMGKMPVLCDLLIQAVHLYPRKRSNVFQIFPLGKVLGGYCTDYLVAIVELGETGKVVQNLILFELKTVVAASVTSINGKQLAQVLVEGYYGLIGCEKNISAIVVALTDINSTHFFKLRLPTTRTPCGKHLELMWYKKIEIKEFPPESTDGHVSEFIEFLHYVLDELV